VVVRIIPAAALVKPDLWQYADDRSTVSRLLAGVGR